jgi:hypothetical protein
MMAAATATTHISRKSRLVVLEKGKVAYSIILKKGMSVRISEVPRKRTISEQHIADQNRHGE